METVIIKEELLNRIAALGLKEAGLCAEDLAARLRAAAVPGVVCALNNADTDHVLLEVLRNDPEKVLRGMDLAAEAIGAADKLLYLPEGEGPLAESLKEAAEKHGVTIELGIVDKRANEGKALLHIVTAADLADAMDGTYVSGVYVSVNGGPVTKVPNGATVGQLADMAGAKALLLGYELRKPEAAALKVEEAGITNGVVKALTERDCVVDTAEQRLMASRKQSCGKCVFCREGLIQLQYMHKEMTEGRGKANFTDLTREIGEAMCYSNKCTMGQEAAKIALSAMEVCESEYAAHIRKKRCPAAACVKLVNIYIDPKRCNGCDQCLTVCPHGCIEGQPGYIHMLDDYECDKCGACAERCPEKAIVITAGRVPRVPERPTKAGRFRL